MKFRSNLRVGARMMFLFPATEAAVNASAKHSSQAQYVPVPSVSRALMRSLLGIAGDVAAPTYAELYSGDWVHPSCSSSDGV